MTNDAIKLRVEELLSQMTLEEKAAQMIQVPYTVVGREESLRWAKLGAGSFLHVLGDDAREVQQVAMQESRLGIPVIFGIDAIHGHGLKHEATIFPTQLAAACSWNPDVVEEMGRVTAREVASDGLHWTFSPVLCLGRDTRWAASTKPSARIPTWPVSWAMPSSRATRAKAWTRPTPSWPAPSTISATARPWAPVTPSIPR